jgi:rhamnogalacturonan endolyase
MRYKGFLSCVFLGLCLLAMPAHGQRIMEKLGRGFVAVGGGTGTLLSWRLYGTEQGSDIAFNVYKGGTKLNATPITTSTNYQDTAAGGGTYTLKAITGGVEEATGTTATNLPNGYLEIPLKDAGGRKIHLAYVGDLDGDGEYDFVVDRFQAGVSQYVDAYKRDGTFMWRVDMGPNSTNTDLSLSGPDTISCGHADDETVYDIDSDGKAELLLRGGNGMIFGDGTTLNASTTQTDSFIVAVDGVTGAEKGKEVAVPQDLKSVGNVTGHFSIAYWDGVHPSLYFKGKAGGTAAMMDMGFDFKDNAWSLRFKAVRTPIANFANNHQVRCVDLDADGIDECVNGGYAIKGDGSIFWNMTSQGVSHGDRWHIGDLDPTRPGLEGWAIGQRSGYDWIYYDATKGTVLRKVGAGTTDLARGTCGDVDPTNKGYECWTGGKVYNNADLNTATALTNSAPKQIGSDAPDQNFRIFWDGDLLSENLNDNKITKWAYPGATGLAFTSVTFTGGIYGPRDAAPLYGDMFGDWREEVLLEQSDSASMRIYTTAIPTDKRIYTLVHDPEYRNSMCEKGYIQSHMLDYYLGDGMTDPPKPNITYPNATPGGTGGASGSGGANGSGGAGSGGVIAAGGTPSTGGATGGRGGRGGSTGNPGTGGATVVASGGTGTITTGGTPASGGTPGTGGNATSGGTTVANSGGAGMAGAGGTSAVAPASGGNTGSGAGGAVAGQTGTSTGPAAADSGCSCAIGITSGGASAGYLVVMLGMLCLVLTRRRRWRGFRD